MWSGLYVFFGGMRGTAWANAFQTSVFMILGVVTFFVIANRLGGEDSILANLQKASQAVADDKLSRSGFSHPYFASYMLIPLSVGMFPHIFQHWLTARSAGSFKLPVVAHPLMILIVWAPCVLVGAWATAHPCRICATSGSPEWRSPTARGRPAGTRETTTPTFHRGPRRRE